MCNLDPITALAYREEELASTPALVPNMQVPPIQDKAAHPSNLPKSENLSTAYRPTKPEPTTTAKPEPEIQAATKEQGFEAQDNKINQAPPSPSPTPPPRLSFSFSNSSLYTPSIEDEDEDDGPENRSPWPARIDSLPPALRSPCPTRETSPPISTRATDRSPAQTQPRYKRALKTMKSFVGKLNC